MLKKIFHEQLVLVYRPPFLRGFFILKINLLCNYIVVTFGFKYINMARVHLTKRFDEKDIESWKKKAVKENRDLTNWMETVLNIAAPKLKTVRKKQGVSNNA